MNSEGSSRFTDIITLETWMIDQTVRYGTNDREQTIRVRSPRKEKQYTTSAYCYEEGLRGALWAGVRASSTV